MGNINATTTVSRFATAVVASGYGVKKGTAPNEVSPIAATTDKPAGIVDTGVDAAMLLVDPTVGVVISGPAWAIAGAAVAIDDHVVLAADGRLVPKSVAGYVVGTATTSAAAGEGFELLVNIRKEPA